MGKDGWSEVYRRRQKNVRKRWNHNGVTTMSVSNIPDGVNKESVSRLFKNFGELTDVYMATKKDAKKKNFAFVRFKKFSREKEMEAKMQGLKCRGSILTINIARFERMEICKKKVQEKISPNVVQQPVGQSFRDGRTFVEVATGRNQTAFPPPPVLEKKQVSLVEGTIITKWLHSPLTLVGKAICLEKLRNIPLEFRMGTERSYEMKYLGGLMVGIRFKSPTEVDEFLTKKNYWSTWFKYFMVGNRVSGSFGRIAWLKIVGLPLELWSEENFSRITSEFGEVLVPIEILPSLQDISKVNVCVLAECKKHINEEVRVEFNRNIFKAGVIESDYNWSPFPFSPSELFGSESNQDVSGEDENACNMDENMLEEGEIKDESEDDDEGYQKPSCRKEKRTMKSQTGNRRSWWCHVQGLTMTNLGTSNSRIKKSNSRMTIWKH
ncbi:unnamed protein product [Lactuca virosa]|uniref:RRM domain-containing protein n=1 Tax=Lactuca virosa TaxID=75947 RepID=A0AAU9N256_9ASTR|nr:unnamed protein product [Lactuca virosa]